MALRYREPIPEGEDFVFSRRMKFRAKRRCALSIASTLSSSEHFLGNISPICFPGGMVASTRCKKCKETHIAASLLRLKV